MSLRNLLDSKTKVSVSATAPGTSRKALLNDSEEPWTSPSLPGHVHLVLPDGAEGATHLGLTFQGGFVATKLEIWAAGLNANGDRCELALLGRVYPEDKSRRQVFELPSSSLTRLSDLKMVLTESSDNQGRITLYQIELLA